MIAFGEAVGYIRFLYVEICYTIAAMMNLDFVCQHPDVVREALRKRHNAQNIDEILRHAEQRRGLITRRDGLYSTLKEVKESLRTALPEQRPPLNKQMKAIMHDIQLLELRISDIETRLQRLLLYLPNIPHAGVPEGKHSINNREVHLWGEPLSFHFEPLPHWELGTRLGIIDAESGVRVAGSRFVTLKGLGARLERALISFMLDVHTREHGYTEVMPPFMVKRSVMQGAGQLPKFEEQAYACTADELFLNPTAEVPLVGLHADSILSGDELPIRYAAWTTAFRREAGSAARATRGLLRQHQFNKVELFQITEPGRSYTVLGEMLTHAEHILQLLELPYRVAELCGGKLPFNAAKAYDVEVWMPSLEQYVEVSSISNCESFQAQRANIKYRPEKGARAEYVHTLNGSGLAVGRTMAAILEIYQQADGTVIVPKVLRPYVGTAVLTAR
jgi:seryl-tRNA synthetase|nr:serine--tRNA ligase [Thermosporothrix hazakensis]